MLFIMFTLIYIHDGGTEKQKSSKSSISTCIKHLLDTQSTQSVHHKPYKHRVYCRMTVFDYNLLYRQKNR